jgi:hypothetical protein
MNSDVVYVHTTAVRRSSAARFSAPSTALPHVGRAPCVINEDEALKIEIGLAGEPILAPRATWESRRSIW